MSLDESSFLEIATGRYGRELLTRYRKKLGHFASVGDTPLPKHDQLRAYSQELFQRVVSGNFYSGSPQDYIVLNKHHGVPRILPVFSFADALVYYFCVFSIQDELAEGTVEGTFGGRRSSNALRRKEKLSTAPEQDDSITYVPYANVNRLAWSKHWREFQAEAYAVSQDGHNSFVVKYDIANFYDSINLNHLERRLRHRCGRGQEQHIDLLMSFLSSWNRRIEGWVPKQVGLPMDVEGEASRILANFYLQEHDSILSDYIRGELSGKYLRYADDMLILALNEADRYRGIVKSGIELHRIGLSINSGKVIQFDDLEDYDYYWAFDLFDKIGDGQDSDCLNAAADIFFCRLDERTLASRPWRHDSVLRRLLALGPKNLSEFNRLRVAQLAASKDLLPTMNDYFLRQIHSFLSVEEKDQFVLALYGLAEETAYTQQLLYIRAFLSALSPPSSVGPINRRMQELADFYRFHLG